MRETAKVILNNDTLSVGTKAEKLAALNGLRDAGLFLVDTVKYPVNKLNNKKEREQAIIESLPVLLEELRELNRERVIIVLKSVYDLVKLDLKNAGLPIVEFQYILLGIIVKNIGRGLGKHCGFLWYKIYLLYVGKIPYNREQIRFDEPEEMLE